MVLSCKATSELSKQRISVPLNFLAQLAHDLEAATKSIDKKNFARTTYGNTPSLKFLMAKI